MREWLNMDFDLGIAANNYEGRQREPITVLYNALVAKKPIPEDWEASVGAPEGVLPLQHAWDTATNTDAMVGLLDFAGVRVDQKLAFVVVQPFSCTYASAAIELRTHYPQAPSLSVLRALTTHEGTMSETKSVLRPIEGYLFSQLELIALAERWKYTGGLDPERATAVLGLMDDALANVPEEHRESLLFTRLFPAIVSRVMQNVVIPRLVALRPVRRSDSTVVTERWSARARVSPEAFEDLKAFHGIDVEPELVAAVSDVIIGEVNRRYLHRLFECAPEYVATPGFTQVETILQAMRALVTQHKERLRPDATLVAVMPPEVRASFDPRTVDEDDTGLVGRMASFSIRDGLLPTVVYEDMFFPPRQVLIGLRNGPTEYGAVWRPRSFELVRSAFTPPFGVHVDDMFEVTEPTFFKRVKFAT